MFVDKSFTLAATAHPQPFAVTTLSYNTRLFPIMTENKITDIPIILEDERKAHILSLMERLIAKNPVYAALLPSIKLVSVAPGVVATRLEMTATHVNGRGVLHGAVSPAIVDFTTGLSIASRDLRATTGASVDMHISYLGTAAVGDTLEIIAAAERVGGSLAYTTARISKVTETGASAELVAIGQHTKYVQLGQAMAKH